MKYKTHVEKSLFRIWIIFKLSTCKVRSSGKSYMDVSKPQDYHDYTTTNKGKIIFTSTENSLWVIIRHNTFKDMCMSKNKKAIFFLGTSQYLIRLYSYLYNNLGLKYVRLKFII